jgi:pilus assembly protein Flp/PilA
MKQFLKSLKSFSQDESGATAIEYGLIAGILSVGIVTILGTVKTDLVGVFTKIGTALTGV